ncbi:MAG: tetratricopeptide repeat protein [Spirochaetia bacterium]|nr:tetratricopeptide repeat protein [Spirochaetia bacterium]
MRLVLASFLTLILASAIAAESPPGYSEALSLYTKGKYEESLAKIRSVFEENKTSVPLRLLAAANHIRAGRANDAWAHLVYATKDHPEQADPMAFMAAYYRRQGQSGEAMNWIGRAIATDPRNIAYKMEAARIYYKAGQYPQARKFTDDVLSQTPGHQEALALDALIFLRQGNPDNAVFRFRQALKQPAASKTALSNVYNNMGVALRKSAEVLDKSGNPAEAAARRTEAVEMFIKALELNPENTFAKANKDS